MGGVGSSLGLGTGSSDRRLAREEPVGERVAHLCRGGHALHPFRAANLTRISVADVSPRKCRDDDMHDNEVGENLRIGLASSHPPSVHLGSGEDEVSSADSQPSVITGRRRESDRSKTGTPGSSDIRRLYALGFRYASPMVSRPRYSLSASRSRVAR